MSDSIPIKRAPEQVNANLDVPDAIKVVLYTDFDLDEAVEWTMLQMFTHLGGSDDQT